LTGNYGLDKILIYHIFTQTGDGKDMPDISRKEFSSSEIITVK
jgi:hypothetical protein